MATVYSALSALLSALVATCASLLALHLFQLESYQLDGYDRARKRGTERCLVCGDIALHAFIVAVIMLLARILFAILAPFVLDDPVHALTLERLFSGPSVLAISAVQAASAFVLVCRRAKEKAKKPLVFTKRMRRLTAVVFALNLAFSLAVCLLIPFLIPFFSALIALLQVWIVRLAGMLIQPVEKRINLRFFKEAQGILAARDDLIKIGITGSYGKTSIKFILEALLSQKYKVLAPPSSFNTPMGLTRVIRERLGEEHQVFLAEMGARHVGDIAELVDLVHPQIGVLSSIGPQHLETFLTLDNIAKTKFELIDGLPPGGAAFFSQHIAEDWPKLYGRRSDIAKRTAGLRPGGDVLAEDISVESTGSYFTLVLPGESPMRAHTKLLGAHNIGNIALCCAVAQHLGLSAEQIAAGIAAIKPIEHRLQLIQGAGGNIVIDDAFNSNPAGAKAALDVLSSFHGRKLIVTPGMVELGDREKELNRLFGEQIAQVADIAIIIGAERSKPIMEGLLAREFYMENAYVVESLDEATELLARIAKPGDITLFENDLPDHYQG